MSVTTETISRPSLESVQSDSSSWFWNAEQEERQDRNQFTRVLRETRSRAHNARNRASDTAQSLRFTFNRKTRKLCKSCAQIPFDECLPGTRDQSSDDAITEQGLQRPDTPLIFCMSLSQILSNRPWCKFCGLLFRACGTADNDLLKADHIKDNLHDSEALKGKGFEEWAKDFPTWKNLARREKYWPFGYTAASSETAKHTLSHARQLFQESEREDINTGSFLETISNSYNSDEAGKLTADALNMSAGIMSITNTKKSKEAQQVLSRVQFATSQFAVLNKHLNGKRRKLPCLVIIRAYRKNDLKCGAISVRVYGHGRALLAPLKEICHFTLRFEGSGEPRAVKEQIWYGRPLRPNIDVEFFKTCQAKCETLHGKNCDSWKTPNIDLVRTRGYPFRLIDVRKMCIVERDIRNIAPVERDRPRLTYVALSYVWGSSDGQQYTQLTTSNIDELLLEDSLRPDRISIPATIRDAMDVTKRTGQRYLWVDSLCVIQHGNVHDLTNNISRMHGIYGEALFTIVAADTYAKDGIHGISTPRDLHQICDADIVDRAQILLPVSVQSNYEPWETRAWCFQEKLLSRRMLVFFRGFAVWRCGGGIWREDANALDGDGGGKAFQGQKLIPVAPQPKHDLERMGMVYRPHDESTRLYRTAAMDQYIRMVENFSGRKINIADSWKVLGAFKGVENRLKTKDLLGSSFRYGLPVDFMDIALLWQPLDSSTRRTNGRGGHALCAPSWSWAGWEDSRDNKDSKGAAVAYEQPYEVRCDNAGLLRRPIHHGEERLRPHNRLIWGKSANGQKIIQLGAFGLSGINTGTYKDWDVTTSGSPVPIGLDAMSDQHLILDTAVVALGSTGSKLDFGGQCFRVERTAEIEETRYVRETFEDTRPPPQLRTDTSTTVSRISDASCEIQVVNTRTGEYVPEKITKVSSEEWVVDTKTRERVGIVKMNAGHTRRENSTDRFEAIVLSESQFIGWEKDMDVLGYPVYNIMIVTRKRNTEIVERAGLGRIYKFAWRNSSPEDRVVVLG